eukprot:g840.t1
MKIYAHVETTKPCTLIIHTVHRSTIDDLKLEVLKKYEAKQGQKLSPSEVQVNNKYKKPIEGALKVDNYFDELDDVFIVPKTTKASLVNKEMTPKATSRLSDTVMEDLLTKGKQESVKSHFKTASDCYEKILANCPSNKEALVSLIQLWIKIGRPNVVEKWSDEALKYYSTDLDVIIEAGKLKHACKDYEESSQLFNKALDLMKKKDCGVHKLKDVQILAANSMYFLGGVWEAPSVQLVMSVVEPERTHFEGLLLYAKIALNRGLIQDAVRVLLRLIVQQKEHEEIKQLLADCFENEESLEFVFEELKTGEGLGSACAFLAARIKDFSAIPAAIKLYERALEVEAKNPSIALNYLHTLELILQVDKAFEFAKTFLKRAPISLIPQFDNKDIALILQDLAPYQKSGELGWMKQEGWESTMNGNEVEEIVEETKFSDEELDLLAFMFTVVKMSFIGGALERVRKMTELISLCCKASKTELHRTLIRNEAAYFNCIHQIIKQSPPPSIIQNASFEAFYLCGDSHCLSGAWRRVEVFGKEHVLVPKLVTGCKVWHLRKESRFYPKAGFAKVMESIPNHSSVILLFGEIDCREGISLAVEKCKYDSQTQAIEKTISIYLEVIEDLIAKRDFTIYVHPVPPVLDVTRLVVKAYNQALKKAIVSLMEKKEATKGKLYWLDFFNELLSEDGRRLKPQLEFDETHLAPCYTQYLQNALLKCHTN